MRKLICWALLPLLLLAACDPGLTDRKPIVHTYEADGFRFTFSLQTEDGTVATRFKKGEAVHCSYIVENLRDDTAYIADSYSEPFDPATIYTLEHGNKTPFTTVGGGQDIYFSCYHIPPHGIKCYPSQYTFYMPVEALAGIYSFEITPLFAYYEICVHGTASTEQVEKRIVIDIPNMNIQFEVL